MAKNGKPPKSLSEIATATFGKNPGKSKGDG